MARLFTDGGELGLYSMYSTASGGGDNRAIQPVADVRAGSYGARAIDMIVSGGQSGSNNSLIASFTASGEIYVRLAFKMVTHQSTSITYFLAPNGSAMGTMNWGTMVYTDHAGNTFTLSGFSSTSWHVYEFHIKLTSTYSHQVRVDGALFVNSSPGSAPSQSTIDRVQCYNQVAGGAGSFSCRMYVDDIAINDTTTGADNSWVGDGSVVALHPSGNDTTNLDGSDGNQTDNYLLVDDPYTYDDDSTYVKSAVANTADIYLLENLPALASGDTIARVWAMIRGRKEGVTTLTADVAIKSGSTTTSPTIIPSLTSAYKDAYTPVAVTDPDTGVAWTESGVNALKIQARVVSE